MATAPIADICIVGGGPAGLAAAIAVAQSGCHATVIDRATPPIDKACGEGLMPDSIAVLNRLGVTVPLGTGHHFRGIRFANNDCSVTADFPAGMGIGMRRLVLHELLLQRARELGVVCQWGAKDVEVSGNQVSVGRRRIACDFLIAADGQNSSLRRACGLQDVVREQRRYGFRRHYRMAPWSSYIDLHWAPTCQIYITPVATDEICVASLSRSPQIRLDDALAHFPDLCERLKGAEPASREMGALSVSRKLRRVHHDRVALVGDASGSVDAITGEGLCLSFKQALCLAHALQSGRLDRYQAEHDKLSQRPQLMSMLMLSLDQRASFQRKALAGLASCPRVFSSLLALHVGAGSIGDVISWRILDFCRAFLEA